MCGMFLVAPGKKSSEGFTLCGEVFFISSVYPVKAVQQYSGISSPHSLLWSLVKYVSLAEHFCGMPSGVCTNISVVEKLFYSPLSCEGELSSGSLFSAQLYVLKNTARKCSSGLVLLTCSRKKRESVFMRDVSLYFLSGC